MRAGWAFVLLALTGPPVCADVVSSSTTRTGGTGSGGGVASPIAGEYVITGEWSWGTADDAANTCSLGETPGAIVFEGGTADAFETTLSVTDPTMDVTYNLPAPHASGAGAYVIFSSAPQSGLYFLQEEFVSGYVSQGQLGATGWYIGAGTAAAMSAAANHPGLISLSSSGTVGTVGRILLGMGTNFGMTHLADLRYFAALISPNTGTTLMSTRVGLVISATVNGEAAQGIYWSFDPASSANWRSITRDGAGITANTTTTAYTIGAWYLLEIRRTTAGNNWEFWLNGVLQFTHSTNVVATSSNMVPLIAIETTEAGISKLVSVDWAAIASVNALGVRF